MMPRVLVIEDSPTQALELRLILESEGFAVETASTGQAGLERLAALPVDLVLSDVLLPDLSGYEVCRRIKTESRTREVPVVLLTVLTDPLDILQGLECGADNFLTKPCAPRFLVERIRRILAGRERRARREPESELVLSFHGKSISITSDKEQIVDLLLTTLEDFIHAREREAALRQRAEDLAEANRRRMELQALLAHELRNPLAPILNGLQILRRPGVDPRTREQALEAAERQVRHLSHLLADLLEVSRLELGKLPLRAERLDLGRLVRAAAEDRRPVLEKAGLALRVDVPQTPVWVRGDSTRLTQVLANLLDNSKFTDPGGRIEVRLEAVAEKRQAVLTVRDTGIGMDAATLHQLFQPFRQADQGLAHSRGGLGLGLWVVKTLVDLYGGQVEAASAGPGRGSTFTVRLPLEPEPGAVAGKPSAEGAPPRRLRIVVIEDNRDAAESLRLLLEVMGHEVAVARTGPEGVQTAARCRPDVVVSDIGLPGLDGYGVARELRCRPETARTRLVALTGYGSEEDRRRSREAGFDVHLCKPADPQELMQLLLPGKPS
jgi:DNA-binding response OmpR family regulator/anti-sigma regulatory factor (Ser/Thr protein kinase)